MTKELSDSDKVDINNSSSILALIEILVEKGLIDYQEFSSLKEKYRENITKKAIDSL